MFKVSFKHRAEKQFDDLTPDFKQKIYDGLGRLSQEGLAHSNVRKIKRTKLGYRLRVGRWRIFFAFFDKEKHIEAERRKIYALATAIDLQAKRRC